MKTIQLDEILAIYKACGIENYNGAAIRYQINTGSLDRQLNTGRLFYTRNDIFSMSNVTNAVCVPQM